MTDRPRIGVLLDYEQSGSFSTRPHNALRTAYFDAVWSAGGLPLGLGYQDGSTDDLVDAVQGLLIPGGSYPFPEQYYGAASGSDEPLYPRHRAELALVTAALARQMPVLGICAGMQVIAAQAGIRLFKDLHNDLDCDVDHLDEKPAEEPAHAITVAEGTQLHRILGVGEMMVNTAHNEAPRPPLSGDAIADAANGAAHWPAHVRLSAVAPDGVIEGLERTDQSFCIGVQWHPEFFAGDENDPNARLFRAFVTAARGYDSDAGLGQA